MTVIVHDSSGKPRRYSDVVRIDRQGTPDVVEKIHLFGGTLPHLQTVTTLHAYLVVKMEVIP